MKSPQLLQFSRQFDQYAFQFTRLLHLITDVGRHEIVLRGMQCIRVIVLSYFSVNCADEENCLTVMSNRVSDLKLLKK